MTDEPKLMFRSESQVQTPFCSGTLSSFVLTVIRAMKQPSQPWQDETVIGNMLSRCACHCEQSGSQKIMFLKGKETGTLPF